MGTAIFMVLMVSGYWYTSHDLSTRFKFKRSFGWDVYFLVALYGCVFVVQGILATGLLWLCLLIASAVMNAWPTVFGPEQHHLHMSFMNWSFLGIQAPVVIMLAFAVIFCLWRSNWSGSARLDSTGRRELYKHLSRANGVEGLIYQCMEKGDLAWITLKSQRIYIGMIHTATFDSGDANNIVLIPMSILPPNPARRWIFAKCCCSRRWKVYRCSIRRRYWRWGLIGRLKIRSNSSNC